MFENVDWGAVLLAIVTSSGLVGIILKYYFDNKLERFRENNKLEFYKLTNSFEKEISILKAKLESNTFITNAQYEREFKIYQELWIDMVDCCNYYVEFVNWYIKLINDVITTNNSYYSDIDEKHKEIDKKINEFENKSAKYIPFYNEDIYKKFRVISDIAVDMMCNLKKFRNSTSKEGANLNYYNEEIRKLYNKMLTAKDETSSEIRRYLNEIKVK